VSVAQLVARERRRLRLAIGASGAALALGIAAALAAGGAMLLGGARWIVHPAGPLIAWGLAAALAAAAIVRTTRHMRRDASSAGVARAIERERALRDGSLRGALETAGSGALGRRAAEQIATRLAAAGSVLAPSLHRRALVRGLAAGAAAGLAIVALAAARRSAPDGWRAMRHPVGALTGSILPPLVIEAPHSVLRGDRLTVHLSAPDRRDVTLNLRRTGAVWEQHQIAVRMGVGSMTIGPLDADATLVLTDGRVTSDTVTVLVTDRPYVGDVAIRAIYPAYLGRRPEVVPSGEPARLPRGTTLSIRGRASTELVDVALSKGSDTVHLPADGHDFTGRLSAPESGRWSWSAIGVTGPVADVPAPLEIETLPDSLPRVEIVSPARDTVVLADSRLSVRAIASDDHGIASVSIRSWRQPDVGRPQPETAQTLATPGEPQWSGDVTLDLASRGLGPGDALHLVIAAIDNSPWRQRAESRELVLRVPSLSEQRDSARVLGDSAVARAQAAAKSERQLAQRTGEAARSRTDRSTGAMPSSNSQSRSQGADKGNSDRSLSYQSAEQARALAREQQALQEQVKSLQRDAQSLERQLKAAGALDTALQQRLRETQQLLQQALTPELQAQLEQVMKATQNLSPQDMRTALENLAQMQQRLREQLEKSAEMLKRAAMEGSLQTLRDEAKELAEQERHVADSLTRGDSAAASRASQLGERSRQLSDNAEELSRRLKQEKAEAGPQRLQSASQSAARSAEAMQQVAPGSQPTPSNQTSRAGEQSKAGQQQAQGRRTDGEQQQTQSQQQQSQQQQSGQQQSGQQQAQGGQQQSSGARQQASAQGAEAARSGAEHMEEAAQQLAMARDQQIQEWKNELTGELDRSIQETLQLARQQEALSQRARAGTDQSVQSEQAALQQGVDKVGERVEREAQRSSHVSQQSQSAVAEARKRVQEATQMAAEGPHQGPQAASAMQDAAESLNRAAASMVRDRERAANAQSASGFAEMLQRMREMAKEQGSVNAQSAGLLPIPGQQVSPQAQQQARTLARQQRGLAERMDQSGETAGRADQLAREMRQIADALEQGRIDPSLLDRQQRLFRRMLDAGLSIEKDEREDTGKRESRSATGNEGVVGGTVSSGRAATRYREPNWNELRGLSAEERRAVLEYFKRINADEP